jgi:hypothetical protein
MNRRVGKEEEEIRKSDRWLEGKTAGRFRYNSLKYKVYIWNPTNEVTFR